MSEFIHKEQYEPEDVSDIIVKMQALREEIVGFDMEHTVELQGLTGGNALDIIFSLTTMIDSANKNYHLTREQCESLLGVAQSEFEKLKQRMK